MNLQVKSYSAKFTFSWRYPHFEKKKIVNHLYDWRKITTGLEFNYVQLFISCRIGDVPKITYKNLTYM